MSFDDSTGGIDRLMYKNQGDLYVDDDWGDRKPRRMFDAARTAREKSERDQIAHQEYLERRARIAADATRSRSAPIEAAIKAEKLAQSKTAMGAAMRVAMAKNAKAKAREEARKQARD